MTNSEKAKWLRKIYKPGVKVRLIYMKGEPQMPKGLEGEVDSVDDVGQIHINWSNGSTLALNTAVDEFEII